MDNLQHTQTVKKKSWIKFSLWTVGLLLFAVWMQNFWLLLGVIPFVDIFITKKIPWTGWRNVSNPKIREVLDWVDDIVFALVAVYIINLFFFQNYQIPSSSLEKTLLVGDYLFVSKLSYGPRIPNTPISFPLVQNTLPVLDCKSYIEWPNWGYKRVKGFGNIKRNDIVVFNFPAGDTVALNIQNPDYYTLVEEAGYQTVHADKRRYGEIIYRPVDKRENYVKRCVGMPGDSLQIIAGQVFIDGIPSENPSELQFNYLIETDGGMFTEEQFQKLNVSRSDRRLLSGAGNYRNFLLYLGFLPNENGQFNPIYSLPLTDKARDIVAKIPFVKQLRLEEDEWGATYPIGLQTNWNRDNFGPLWIPKKGTTIQLSETNIAIYKRCIENYENNKLQILPDGRCLINGQQTDSYTFKYDYYFMMGDNRHNSADSRMWGFVPEDHIVGKPILIWLSLDKDKSLFNGKIRWNRMFTFVHK